MKLKEKKALVTGGGRGIGRAIALKFTEEGASVAVVSRTQHDLEEVADKVHSMGGRALDVVCDLSDEKKILSMVNKVISTFDRIDILVNNAGVFLEKSVTETQIAEWDHILKVNLRSVFICTKAVLKYMIDQRSGKIINIASGSGIRGLPSASAYSASKAGVIAFTESLSEEVRHFNINVNAICPGPVKTEMLNLGPASLKKRFDEMDLIDAEQVANAAVFLASENSKAINGQIINVRNRVRW